VKTIKFILYDQVTDGIAVEEDGREVWSETSASFDQYLRHYMPRGVPVLLDSDTRPSERREERANDERPYPDGQGTDSRLQRWLVDNGHDPRIRDIEYDEDDQAVTEAVDVTMSNADLYQLLLFAAERFYFYGVDDVRERYGIEP
jgi:hypothetical protein